MNEYYENLKDHSTYPRHNTLVLNPDFDLVGKNPYCGDTIRITFTINAQNIIDSIGWLGEGCTLSQASASIFCDLILGMSIEDMLAITKEEYLQHIGIPLLERRLYCVLLPYNTAIGYFSKD